MTICATIFLLYYYNSRSFYCLFVYMQHQDIKDLSKKELKDWLASFKIPAYRASQVFRWIYSHQKDNFSEMGNLGTKVQDLLNQNYRNQRLQREGVIKSTDGSEKYLFRLADGKRIESVLMAERGHSTLCISSQAGCAQKCSFCLSGENGLLRNLTKSEIIGQVRDILSYLKEPEKLTNIVFMGMGEPLANYRNVKAACDVLLDAESGLGFSKRKITLSTCGIIPKIKKMGEELDINLAVSLNAATNESRNHLMPINKRYPLEDLMKSLREFPVKPYRRVTIEYILIKDVNDCHDDAKRLAKLLKGIKSKINLIPFNEYRGSDYKRPIEEVILKFQKILIENKFTAIIRKSKGQDIGAACGQLKFDSFPQ